MEKILMVTLVLFFSMSFFSLQAKAEKISLLGGSLDLNMIINTTSISLKDSADSIYLGTLDGKWQIGIGAETSLFYPLAPGMKAGPHFIFNYTTANSSWHFFSLFQTSLGGIIDFNLDNTSSLSAFLDYNLGWFSAEQEISSVSGSPAPAGAFSGGIPGLIFGIKTRTQFSETIRAGIYYNIGLLALTGIKYKNSSGQNNWMNAEISFNQVGVTIYF